MRCNGQIRRFLLLAKTDLKTSELILNSSNDELMLNNAAYHTQQAVEKICKALILSAGDPPGTSHSIASLAQDMDRLDLSYPEWVNEDAYDISSWATTIRYNANFEADHDMIERINNWPRRAITASCGCASTRTLPSPKPGRAENKTTHGDRCNVTCISIPWINGSCYSFYIHSRAISGR